MSYRIEWLRSAAKELHALPDPIALRIGEVVESLPKNLGHMVAGHKDLWRIRAGNYRVIYFIGDAVKLVRIERVSDRKDAYR